jgi:hypothetical protein
MLASDTSNGNNAASIFGRIWEKGSLSPQLARHILKLDFTQQDKARMHELAEKNRSIGLSATEECELDDYIRAGDLLALVQSKARKLLRKRASTSR